MRRRTLILSLAGVLLLPPLLLLALVATETGSRALVQAGSGLVPGLTVARVQGRLLGEISLANVHYHDGGELQVRVDTLLVRWRPASLLRGELHLHAVQARGLLLELPESQAQAASPYPVQLPQQLTPPLPVQLDQLLLEQLTIRQGQQQWQFAQFALSGRMTGDRLTIDALQLEGEGVRLAASGQVGTAYPYPLAVRWDGLVELPEWPGFAGQGELAGDAERLTLRQQLRLPQQAGIMADMTPDLVTGRHRFEITAEWDALAVATGDESLVSRQGRLTVTGELSDYAVTLATTLQHPAVAEPVGLEINGRGDLDRIQVEHGLLRVLGGEGRFTGMLGWNPVLVWQAELQAAALETGRQWPEWPGTLGLEAGLHGSIVDDRLRLELELRQLQGTLRDYPVDAGGQLAWDDERLVVRAVKLRSGDNRIYLDGEVHPGLQLAFEVDASDLRQVAPQLAGRLSGKGILQGGLPEPVVQMQLQGSTLSFDDMHVGELVLEADIDPADAERSRFTLQGERLDAAGFLLDALTLTGTGNAARHRLTATATGPEIDLYLHAGGAYAGAAWRGELSALTANNARLGRWELQQPVLLQADGAVADMEPLCLVQGPARLCGRARYDADGRLHGSGELGDLPLALFNQWLAEDATLDGVVNGSFRLEGRPEQLQAEAELQASAGILHYSPPDGPGLVADHHDGHLSLHYRDDTLQLEFGLGLGDDGRLSGSGRVGPALAGQRVLAGELDFGLADPAALGALAPRLGNWAGPMSLHAGLGGTLQQPTVRLDGRWRNGQVSVPELDITFSAIQLAVSGDGRRIDLTGEAVSGKGRVQLEGSALLDAAAGWPLNLHITGSDFQVARRSDLELAVSPDLELALAGHELNLTGKLVVPSARIRVADIPAGVVRTSPDEIIVDTRAGPAEVERRKTLRTHASINLVLGEAVHLAAYGLDSRLAGELELRQRPDAPLEAIGQLQLLEGTYKGYGQNLSIEQGRLLFAGPLEAAEVNVRAVRKVKDVTAGIQLTGPLVRPVAELFSTPPLEEAEILSYLLTGGPMSAGTGMNAAMLTQAAVGLGLDKSGSITGQISETLGLDELSVEEGEDGFEGSAMSIGKRLSPDMYVRYVYGLFDGSAILQLRYSLSERLRLEVGTGTQQSLDVLYEIERD